VASGAGRYNPAFYGVVGLVARPFNGTSALYAMRAAAAGWCAVFFWLILRVVHTWSSRRALLPLLLVGLTPTVMYSAAIAAPNGVEMMAGLLWWVSLIALLRPGSEGDDRPALLGAMTGGFVLIVVRSLGPLWCVLALTTCLLALPISRTRAVEIVRQRWAIACVLVLAAGSAFSLAWIMGQKPLQIGIERVDYSTSERISLTLQGVALWPFQMIGAFPYRDQPAWPFVYLAALVLGVLWLAGAWAGAANRLRFGIGLCVAVAMIVPAIITYSTLEEFGTAWQGRYTLPYALGLWALVGLGWAQKARSPASLITWISVALFAVAHLLSLVRVVYEESRVHPANEAWHVPPLLLMVSLPLLATAFLAAAVRESPPARLGIQRTAGVRRAS
jgi:hypothetical protein